MNKVKKNKITRFCIVFIILFLIALNISLFSTISSSESYESITNQQSEQLKMSSTGYFTEDFDTTTYRDEELSTIDGWGFGNVFLPEKNITLSKIEKDGLDMFVDGDLAYICGADGLSIYNISNSSSPILLGYDGSLDYLSKIFVIDGYLFFTSSNLASGFIGIVDVSSPANVQLILYFWDYYMDENLQDHNSPESIWVLHDDGSSNWFIYIMDSLHGFVSLLFAEPDIIFQTGGYDPAPGGLGISANLGDLFIEGNIAYASYGNLLIMDITNKVNPLFLSIYIEGNIEHMYLQGDLIYYENAGMGTGFAYGYFIILNISDPFSPYIMFSTPDLGHDIGKITVSGDFACLGYSVEIAYHIFESHYDVYNISDPTAPYIMYSYISPDTVSLPWGGWWFGIDCIIAKNDYWYMMDTHFFIEDFNLLGQHENNAVALSSVIFSNDNTLIKNATLISNATIPMGTSIFYYLSTDNGLNWEQVYNNTSHQINHFGNILKWKAEFSTIDSTKTPIIYSLDINYIYILKQVNLTLPLNSSIIYDNTPYFLWTLINGAVSYLLQIDISTSFNSIHLRNITIMTNYYTPIISLPKATWYWRVVAKDSDGDLGSFSEIRTLIIDITPVIAPLLLDPSNNSLITVNKPDFAWNTVLYAKNYTFQLDTSISFSSINLITVSGIISTSLTLNYTISDGQWYWRVSAFDALNNESPYSNIYYLTIDTSEPPSDGENGGNGGGNNDRDGEAIPGYNIWCIIGILSVIFIVLLKNQKKTIIK